MSAARNKSSSRARSALACRSSSSIRLLTLKARQSAPLRSLPGGSSLITSAPRSASTRPATQPSRSVASTIVTLESRGIVNARTCSASSELRMAHIRLLAIRHSPPAAGERVDPADHARLGVLDVLLGEEVLRLDLVHRINRPQEVALVTERHRRIDAHAAL